MKVFLSGTSFAAEYGGPARSVSALAMALAHRGVEVGVWAADDSARRTPFLSEGDHLRILTGGLQEAFAAFGNADLIHDNGIWLSHNHELASLALKNRLPRLISIRGMLSPWALAHKRWKKRVAWALYQKSDLKSAACHHVTAGVEAESVRAFDWDLPICCIPNGVDVPVAQEVIREGLSSLSGNSRNISHTGLVHRTAVFVGRIHPVKGLPLLVEAWKKVSPLGWKMKIVGPDEVGHRSEVESLIGAARLNADFEFVGSLAGDDLSGAYADAELFILPSHTENFGMAVGEALAHGLPVITTHGTPWQLLEEERCGWWVPISADGIARALDDATSRSAAELSKMGQRGKHIVVERFSWDKVADDFIDCYGYLLGKGAKPKCME